MNRLTDEQLDQWMEYWKDEEGYYQDMSGDTTERFAGLTRCQQMMSILTELKTLRAADPIQQAKSAREWFNSEFHQRNDWG